MSKLKYDENGELIIPFKGQATKTWTEIQRERRYEEDRERWKAINKQTKPWTNSGKAYTDEEFRIVLDGNSDDEKDLIEVGKKFKRKATAIRELRLFRNRYLDNGEIPQCFWGQSISRGKHDLPNKIDHQGQQLKRIIDEMPDYYKGFT